MRTNRTVRRAGGWAVAVSLAAMAVPTAPLGAQDHEHAGMAMPERGVRAELIRDIEQLEAKYLGLVEAMGDHFDWRPGEGVRSAGEVFGHVAAANFMIPSMVGIEPPAQYRGDEGRTALQGLERAPADQLIEELRHSFMHARHAIARTPDDELDSEIRLFGREATKRAALTLLVAHMHEHLGQSIAYARTNGVRPPWSGG